MLNCDMEMTINLFCEELRRYKDSLHRAQDEVLELSEANGRLEDLLAEARKDAKHMQMEREVAQAQVRELKKQQRELLEKLKEVADGAE